MMEPTQEEGLFPAQPADLHYLDSTCYEAIKSTLYKLRAAKPQERRKKARRYAVVITDMEKVLAYFGEYVMNDGDRP